MNPARADVLLRHLRHLTATGLIHEVPDRELLLRFSQAQDEAAFTDLVRRHGPMVQGVCRRVLGHEQDAEDVFQSTFLVLARKAGSARWQESVGAWLYEVARRLACKARGQRERSLQCQPPAPSRSILDPLDEITLGEAQRVLDEELSRLPRCYRAPLVLCHLEGATRDEASQQLGWALTTFRRRLKRGQELLRSRLARRGLDLSSAGTIPFFTPASDSIISVGLLRSTVQSALLSTNAVSGRTGSSFAALLGGPLRLLLAPRALLALVLILTVGVIASVGALANRSTAEAAREPDTSIEQTTAKPAPEEVPPAAKKEKTARSRYQGVVLDPQGKPLAGARLYLFSVFDYTSKKWPKPTVRAVSGPDGRFDFTVDPSAFPDKWWYTWAHVVAAADGYGLAWAEASKAEGGQDLKLQVVEDDVSVQGRVLDLQGRPIRGVKVRILDLKAAAQSDLSALLAAVKEGRDGTYVLERDFLVRSLHQPEQAIPGLPEQVTTDADGRFRITGIGRERVLSVRFEAPTIETREARIVTRGGPALQAPRYKNSPRDGMMTYYGATFTHPAAPTQAITGVVRDKDTGQPLAGVRIQSWQLAGHSMSGETFIHTTTDTQGRYLLTGMPRGEGNTILVVPTPEQPYHLYLKEVGTAPVPDPVKTDIDLTKGIWVEGKVIDKATGKGVSALVDYYALAENPNLKKAPGFFNRFHSDQIYTDETGFFRVVTLPGPGVLAVRGFSGGYLLANQVEEGKKLDFLDTRPFALTTISYHRVVSIDPPANANPFKTQAVLDPGLTLTGTLLDPDGKPLRGAHLFSSHPWGGWHHPPLKTAEYKVVNYNPRQPRTVVALHAEKQLAKVLPFKLDDNKPHSVRLEPCGQVVGRLVDEDGQPRPGVELSVIFRGKNDDGFSSHFTGQVKTDRDGRFRIESLVPGLIYQVGVQGPYQGRYDTVAWIYELPVQSGKTKDMGDVKAKPVR
jgi:RNA polymerase sigma factor (sigma-70 family)